MENWDPLAAQIGKSNERIIDYYTHNIIVS